WAAPARAQAAAYSLRLVSQPVWAAPGDRLNLKLQILNRGESRLKGFRLIVGLHDPVRSRSALHESFGPIATSAPLSLPSDFSTSIAAGSSQTVTLDDRLSEFASVLGEADQGGVFPVTVALAPRGGTEVLAQLTTDLLYFPSKPDVPLNFVLNVPVNAPAARGPDGAFGPIDERWPLEDALAPGGWLATLENGMEKAGGRFHAGLAPTPRLLEELADISNGYRRVTSGGTTQTVGGSDASRAATDALERLGDLAGGGSQLLLTPYSFPDLPTLDKRLGTAELLKQLTVGAQKTRAALGVEPGGQWLFAPAGRIDSATLTDLRLGQYGAHTSWSEDSLEQPDDPSAAGCPTGSPSFTCPVAVEAAQGKSTGYATDGGIEDRFAALAQGGQDRLDLQRLFAETALIWAELPGTEGRVVQATVPSLWHPRPAIANKLFSGLAHAPWLRMRTPASALAHSVKPVARHLVQDLGPLHDDPGTSYFDAVAAASSEVSSFDQVGPPTTLLDRLSNNVLVAQSRLWWQDSGAEARGRSFAEESANTARAELEKIDIGGVPEITMTSRSEDVPLVVFNDTGYPVNVLIHLSAQSLGLDRTIPERVAARTQQISVRITAKNSGIDPLQIALETPDCRVIQTKTIRIRSTNFNEVALAITLGAGIFLLLFYMMRGVRRRRSAGTEPDPDPQTA
ncbi:MAG: DUF6049 family protein, partial [Actinomycetota bacterium]|nr:DUF6049 family protein [Actinomycetota bacterium]